MPPVGCHLGSRVKQRPSNSAPLTSLYDVPAPAKLNLFLHITGRRPDGYHLLQSVFMLIDWCDTLHFELRTDGLISRTDLRATGSDAKGSPEELPLDDLTVRAARALKAASGTSLGVHITLEKNIPSQAGMGGGSSDAASCLLALQRLWGVRLPAGHAWVEGIGEKITPIALPAANFVVVKPVAGVPTQDIFRAPDLKRDTETATIQGFAAYPEGQENLKYRFGHNDLQPVAQGICPQIKQSLDWLEMQQLQGRMTGSGSAVFAQILHDTNLAAAPGDWKIRKCKNLEMHPLSGW